MTESPHHKALSSLSFAVTRRDAIKSASAAYDFHLDPCTQNVLKDLQRLTATRSEGENTPAAAGGVFYEMLSDHQFRDAYDGVVRDAGGGPRAFCGAVAPAAALRIAQHLAAAAAAAGTAGDIAAVMAAALADVREHFGDDARSFLGSIVQMRHRLLESAPAMFPSDAERASFLKNWTANYEVSDVMQDRLLGGSLPPAVAAHVAFLRSNQAPELATATADERVRLLREEMSFGGVPCAKGVDPVRDTWQHGDASVFIETFHNNQSRPKQPLADGNDAGAATSTISTTAASLPRQTFVRLLPAGECRCRIDDAASSAALVQQRDEALARGSQGEPVTSVVASVLPSSRAAAATVTTTLLPKLPFAAVLDLKGHFAVGVFFEAPGTEHELSVCVVNSMDNELAQDCAALHSYLDFVSALFAASNARRHDVRE